MTHYPLRLCGLAHTAIWGGTTLRDQFGKGAPGDVCIAESWELTLRPDGANPIENGPCAGMTLADYLTHFPDALGGEPGRRFPLLVKLIDAARPLSIQVHPDDAYAARQTQDGGKTEMWYIVDAAPGARLVLGMREGVSEADFAAALTAGDPSPCLRSVEVRAGECYFVPAGYLHAIGMPGAGEGGILVAEIQQNSDLTYRVWDYSRPGLDGMPRPLHIAQALDVLRAYTPDEVEALRFAGRGRFAPLPGEVLCAAEQFAVSRLTGAGTIAVGDSFVSLLCAAGEGSLTCAGVRHRLCRGDSYFLPAGLSDCRVDGDAVLLLSRA